MVLGLLKMFQFLMNHRLVETHIFSFVVGRAFVTDIDKLKIGSKTRSLDVEKVLRFFSEVTKVCLLKDFTKCCPCLFYPGDLLMQAMFSLPFF